MSINVNDKNLGHATAYAYYKAGGGTMTEAKFTEFMADFGTASQTAVEAAQAALASKNAAQTAAITATNKASEATTAATTATTKAGEASTSASTATSAKDTAVSAASTATTKATEATTAAATATSAATTATTAKDDAVSAKTAAQTAQTGAETAAASVSASAAQIATNTDDIAQLKSDLNQKANADGSYDTLTAGNAKQLLSNLEQTDIVPYNYRTAGGSLEIGDREKLKKIVGGSLAVNQLVQERPSAVNISQTSTEWTIKALADPIPVVSGHKYAVCVIIASKSANMAVRIRYPFIQEGLVTGANWYVIGQTNLNALSLQTRSTDGETATATLNTKCAMLFDITQMFGTTIADYVYGLETTTAGAGVAWLKAHFPRIFDAGYIPYNAGTLEHVSGLSEHKMVGFNQWDEEWESGRYNPSTGIKETFTTTIRSKNYIPIVPNTSYYCYIGSTTIVRVNFCYYDANKNFISFASGATNPKITPSNAYYMTFYVDSVYGTTYNHDICINLHWDGERDGEYEPYEEHSYPLDSDVTLRGIYKLDANNSLYADGDEYASDGTVTRRYGIVDLGTLTWGATSNYGNVYRANASISNAINDNTSTRILAPMILSTSNFKHSLYVADAAANATSNLIGIRYNGVYVTFDASKTAAEVKSALNGIYMVYELITPTTESADPYTEIQNVSNWGTEEFVSESLVPVGHETAYQPDLRAKIEVAPESPDTDGVYIMQRDNGLNSYVALASSATIQDIISRLEALEGSGT